MAFLMILIFLSIFFVFQWQFLSGLFEKIGEIILSLSEEGKKKFDAFKEYHEDQEAKRKDDNN